MILPPNLNNKIGKTLEKKMTGDNICKSLNEKIYETDEREMLYEIHKNLPVHGNDGSLVRVKVDEPIASRFPSKLVGHDLDAHHPTFSHHIHGILKLY